jgi:FdhD protein
LSTSTTDLTPELGWPTYRVIPVHRWVNGCLSGEEDAVAEETPVVLTYNGEPHVVMLTTPLDLEDFALGFSLTEQIIQNPDQVESIRVFPRAEGIEVRIRLKPGANCQIEEKGRNLTGRTGCGLCGATSLKQAIKHPPPVHSSLSLPWPTIQKAMEAMRSHQRVGLRTGSVHAAGWLSPEHSELQVREDVGRHNALDKLIGALAAQNTDFSAGAFLVTSRASFEMVQKCAIAGSGMLIAISAPTALAVRLAHETGVTLVGFARETSHVVYSHAHRLTYPDQSQHNASSS